MQTIFPILHETLLFHDIETKDVLAINDDIYTSLINSLLKEDLSKTAQPKLFVGGVGCGKTFLIKGYKVRSKRTVVKHYTLSSLTENLYIQQMIFGLNVRQC